MSGRTCVGALHVAGGRSTPSDFPNIFLQVCLLGGDADATSRLHLCVRDLDSFSTIRRQEWRRTDTRTH